MGKKKRPLGSEDSELVYAKKQKTIYVPDDGLSALAALHLYARKNKLGVPGFRERATPDPSQQAFVCTVVLDGAELASAQHPSGDRDACMEKAALLSLHLMDPEAHSICTMIVSSGLWRHPTQIDPSEDELNRFKERVQSAPIKEAKYVPEDLMRADAAAEMTAAAAREAEQHRQPPLPPGMPPPPPRAAPYYQPPAPPQYPPPPPRLYADTPAAVNQAVRAHYANAALPPPYYAAPPPHYAAAAPPPPHYAQPPPQHYAPPPPQHYAQPPPQHYAPPPPQHYAAAGAPPPPQHYAAAPHHPMPPPGAPPPQPPPPHLATHPPPQGIQGGVLPPGAAAAVPGGGLPFATAAAAPAAAAAAAATSSPTTTAPRKYRAKHKFEATEPGWQLSLQQGDALLLLTPDSGSGWCDIAHAGAPGRKGKVPSSYVEPAPDETGA